MDSLDMVLQLLGINKQKLEEIGKQLLKTGTCIICGGKPTAAALYVPNDMNDNAMVGAPAGKLRIGVYGLCDKCLADPDSKAKATKAFLEKSESEQAIKINMDGEKDESKDKPLLN